MLSRSLEIVRLALYRHRVLIIIVLIHTLVAQLLSLWTGRPFSSSPISFLLAFILVLWPLFGLILLIGRVVWMAVVLRPDRPIQLLWSDVRRVVGNPERIANGLIAFVLIALFTPAFSFIKDVIPVLVPFSWDVTFAAADRALHFGMNPYEILWPIIQSPLAVTILNAAYHFWFFLMFFLLSFACFMQRKPEIRMTFLLAYLLTWFVGGNLLAVLFSSAGPVYYARLGFGDMFRPLMDQLAANAQISPVWALHLQEALWNGYLGNGTRLGISAMPSLHIGSTVLLTLFVACHSRTGGWLMAAFLLAIFLGSIVLGWHYAIDGYAGALVAVVMWKLAGWIVRSKKFSPSGERRLVSG